MSAVAIAPQVRPGAAKRSSVRLTRRGRLVVFVAALAAVLGCILALAGGAMGTDEVGAQPPTEVIVVGTGDTLWGIASEVGDGDVRDTMGQIKRLNALDTVALQAGQRLRVPVAG